MRFEPSNAKFFSVEVNWESVTTVLRLTAAFNENTELSDENEEEGTVKPLLIKCHQVFLMEEDIHLGLFIQCSSINLINRYSERFQRKCHQQYSSNVI